LAPVQSRILGTVQKQSGDLLAGNATLLDQLQQCILHFDVQELLQFYRTTLFTGCLQEFETRDSTGDGATH
jgi:hypothetical protein